MSLAPGQTVSHYTITAALGAGGMGEVYRARDTTLDRDVALKLLPQAFAADPDRVARFEREAKLLASLNHPGIAHLYGFEVATLEDGTQAHVLAMELVLGEDLAARLERGPLALDEALEVARQLCAALEEAHEKGIVHRDLKPANVKLTPDGKVKVLDFGLAKAWTGDASGAVSTPDLSQSPTLAHTGTAAGLILGTAAYMSPEQARGRPVDKRTDVWSFGALLYEMLTGRALFSGETVSDVLAGVLAREIDWTPLPAGTPASLRRLLARCLERDPRQRLRDIGDARHELQPADSGERRDAAAGPAADGRSWRRTAVVAGASALAAAALTFGVAPRRAVSPPAEPMAFALSSPPDTRLKHVVISPDGRWLVVAAEAASGVSHLWLRRIDSRDARRIEGTAGALDPFWSPDSRFVGFFTEAQLLKLEAATGAVAAVAPATDSRGAAWSDKGLILFGGNTLLGVDSGGGAVTTVLEADGAGGENAIRYPAFLPDGDHVLYYSRNARDRSRAGLWVYSLAGRTRKQLTASAGSSAVYVEPGYVLYRRDRYLLAHPFDARRLELTGEPTTIAEDVWYDPGVTAQTSVSVSRTGVLAFRSGGVELSDLAWFDRQGRLQGTEWEAKGFAAVALARDGRRVLASFPDQGVERHAWLLDRQAGAAQQVTSAGDVITLAFSEDGQDALLGMYEGGVSGLWRARLGSGSAPEPLPTRARGSAFSFVSDWRGPDVIASFFEQRGDRFERRLYATNIENGADRPLVDAPGNQLFGVISPDGRRLAYSSDASGEWEVYVTSFPGAAERWRVSSAGGHQPHWSGDGSELFYIAPDRRLMAVAVRGIASGFQWEAPRPLFQTAIVDLGPFRGCGGYAVAPDGQRFLIVSRRPQGQVPAVAIVNFRPERRAIAP